MSRLTQSEVEAFNSWATSYSGHEIAAQRHYNGWLVYLNKVMQPGMLFEDHRDAAVWLRRKADEQSVATG